MRSLLTLFVLLLFVLATNAQPLTGTKTINPLGLPVGNNYISLPAAVADLNTRGVGAGGVKFVISPGLYSEQKVTINARGTVSDSIIFVSSTGNPQDVIITYNAPQDSITANRNHIFKFTRCKYIALRGVTLRASQSPVVNFTVPIGVQFSQHIVFDNLIVEGSFREAIRTAIDFSIQDLITDTITIKNSRLTAPTYVIDMGRSKNSKIINNTIEEYSLQAIRVVNQTGLTIDGNTITSSTTFAEESNLATETTAIRVLVGDSITITNNKISTTSGRGITLVRLTKVIGENEIANNIITVKGTRPTDGIYVEASRGLNFTYNTIAIQTNSTTTSSTGLRLKSRISLGGFPEQFLVINAPEINLINNIIANYSQGSMMVIDTVNAMNVVQNNAFDIRVGNTVFANWGGVNYTNLANLQTGSGKHTNSVQQAIIFDNSNFAFLGGVNAHLKIAIPQANYPLDITKESRSGTTPYVGADEFNGNGLFGTFIISNSLVQPGDYTSLQSAIDDLANQGVANGGVVVQFRNTGVNYQLNNVELKPIPGASTTNRVIIESLTGQRPILTNPPMAASGNQLIRINNAHFYTLRNLDLSITDIPLTYSSNHSKLINIEGNSSNLRFENCNFSGFAAGKQGNTGTDNNTSLIFSSGNQITDITFLNNTFSGANRGISLTGISITNPNRNIVVIGNTFNDHYVAGVFLARSAAPIISKNSVNFPQQGVQQRGVRVEGIYDNYQITKNRITGTFEQGIYIEFGRSSDDKRGLVANNFIANSITTQLTTGLHVFSANFVDIAHNSIVVRHNTASSIIAFRNTSTVLSGQSTTRFNRIYNNIFQNLGGGLAVFLTSNETLLESDFDYNALFTSGTNLVNVSGTTFTSLMNYQIARNTELNSVQKQVNTLSETDLHLAGNSIGDGDLSGIAFNKVLDDIDDETRTNKPYMGADENISQPLPITLLSFTANKINQTIHLHWKTASELNNDRFEIEVFEQPLGTSPKIKFNKIGEIAGAGNSHQPVEYTFSHQPLIIRGTVYYRLKQVDLDGKFSVTQPVAINLTNRINTVLGIYPNPSIGATQIQFNAQEVNEVKIDIISMLGKTIQSFWIPVSHGLQQHTLNISDIPMGTYTLRLLVGNELISNTLIISE